MTERPAERIESPAHDDQRGHPVPYGVRATASWSWRILVVVGALYVLVRLVEVLHLVIIPFVAALLLAAALVPLAGWFRARGLPRAAATALTMLTFIAVVAGALTLVGNQVASGLPELNDRSVQGFDEIRRWLVDLGVPNAQLDNLGSRLAEAATQNRDQLTSGAISTATLALETVAGMLLALFSLIFLIYDGDGVWRWLMRLVPRPTRARVDEAGRLAWVTLTGYVRGTVLVALVDAVFIYVWLLILRVELALPLAVLVFFGAFIPLVGATLTAALAALVALVTQGPVVALLVVAGIIVVQQVEGHVLQPFLLGRFVRLHPLAVVLSIATGAIVAGIAGALVAVPLVAVINTAGSYLASTREGAQTVLPEAVAEGVATAQADSAADAAASGDAPAASEEHPATPATVAQSNPDQGAVEM